MNDESPLDVLRRKLAELHKAEATATAAAAKFELAEQIKETKDKIRELESVEAGVSAQSASPVVAKGLRSFDQRDADFFLRLLPGPYRADGLPESIHFWKTRIEETDPSKTFRVGVMYGPSGCGKSSLLRAGLLPRLAETVIPVCIDATATDTESELLRELRKRCGFLGPGDDLASLLNRQDRIPAGCKLLLVVDQFEQWLHGRDEDGYRQLTDALRACDGEHAQCMLLIRDDFWTPLTEFLGQLQVRQVEGENTTLVNRFDRRHARKVLTLFGKSYGALPTSSELSKEQVS